jgi:4-amino-4-deoxy-L-arabinose transferase-like glycosyltransferase
MLAGATALCLLPFVGKAFHIDDPLFVWVARHIVEHPLDPYGFSVNWTLTQQPISEITKNPPLGSYLIAAASRVVGWSEIALHLVFLVPALLAVLGTYELARRTCARPVVAALAALLTPAFLVCSTGVTCDTLMLALWVWSIVLWHDGLERKDAVRLAAAMALVAACALTKYFGMALIPLLSAYAIARRDPVRRWAVYLAIPAVPLAAYQAWTSATYGRGLLLDAAAYATNWRAGESISLLDRGLVGLVFAGGCALTALTFAPVVWSKTALAVGAAAAIAGGTLVGLHASTVLADAKTAIGIQACFFLAGGVAVLALAVDDLRRHRDPASLLLALWVAGVFVFACFVNWTINGRSILPMVPAVGILLARRLERLENVRRSRVRIAVPLAAAALVSIWVTFADFSMAEAQRTAATMIRAEAHGRPLWFEGHWGFQYYMQEAGGRSLDVKAMEVLPGDVVALAYNNTRVVGLPKPLTGPTEHFDIRQGAWAATIRQDVGAGFYASVFGPLPYAFGSIPPERYSLIEVKSRY